jgi:hypothetical protein
MHLCSSILERRQTGFRFVHPAFIMTFFLMAILVFGACARATAQSSPQTEASPPSGASPDARDAHGLTPLIVAASAGEADKVDALLAQGAGVNATSADGRTALIAAVQNNHIEIVRSLVAAGANLNLATRGAGTALEVAEANGETEIVAMLLAAGARSSGKSVGDTVCVRPWGGDGFCGTVKSFSIRSVRIQVTKIVGCTNGCSARQECSASRLVGGIGGLRGGDQIAVPSWCLTQTGVKP